MFTLLFEWNTAKLNNLGQQRIEKLKLKHFQLSFCSQNLRYKDREQNWKRWVWESQFNDYLKWRRNWLLVQAFLSPSNFWEDLLSRKIGQRLSRTAKQIRFILQDNFKLRVVFSMTTSRFLCSTPQFHHFLAIICSGTVQVGTIIFRFFWNIPRWAEWS